MDQKTIMDGLMKALANGNGSLDDLDNLLKRAQQDIAEAKEEQKKQEEAQKLGDYIAAMATRILNDDITDDDCAYVVNSWMRKNGYGGKGLTGKDMREIFEDASKGEKKVQDSLDKALEDLAKSLSDWGKSLGIGQKPAAKTVKVDTKDPDRVIDEFLKNFGLK